MDNIYFMDSYEKIKKAESRLNTMLAEQDVEFKWKDKKEYDIVVNLLSNTVNKQLDELINTRIMRTLSKNLTSFLMELGFDESLAIAKASDMIAISRR